MTPTYLGTIGNNADALKFLRGLVKGSGFRIWARGRGPRSIVLQKRGRYTAQSDFPLYLNPPKIALYLRCDRRTVPFHVIKAKVVAVLNAAQLS